jgi:FkbM family methyltransferase
MKDNGDKTHRLWYELSPNSTVFDVGGYEGQWASDIFAMYCCSIYVFEPVARFATNIQKRFSRNPKITVYPFGLASETRKARISCEQDSSSVYKSGRKSEAVDLRKASDFIEQNNIEAIDLMKINIEGGEYELLDHLVEDDLVKRIMNIQVQFHDFVPNAQARMQAIQTQLAKTHHPTYQYPFVWENWRLRDVEKPKIEERAP